MKPMSRRSTATAAIRHAILGNSGSGKSTLARRLSAVASLVTLDLDTVYWEADQVGVARPPSDRVADLRRFCGGNGDWVIEGCYEDLIEASFPWQPELIFLDPGREVCLRNCRSRPHEVHKYASKKEQDRMLAFLLEWVSAYYERDGPMSHRAHLELFARYNGPKRTIIDPYAITV
jgi:adenylate kinase family enzyme